MIVVGIDALGLVRLSELTRFVQSDRPLSPAQARNLGAKLADGEILVFTDADCIPASNWLQTIIQQINDPTISVLGGGVNFSDNEYWSLSDNLSMFYEYLIIHRPGERRQLPSLNLAIRRNVFMDIGGFDERYPRASGEDADLTLRLKIKGYRLHFEPGAVVFHAPHRNRLTDMLLHAYYQGMYSTKVDPRYLNQD